MKNVRVTKIDVENRFVDSLLYVSLDSLPPYTYFKWKKKILFTLGMIFDREILPNIYTTKGEQVLADVSSKYMQRLIKKYTQSRHTFNLDIYTAQNVWNRF